MSIYLHLWTLGMASAVWLLVVACSGAEAPAVPTAIPAIATLVELPVPAEVPSLDVMGERMSEDDFRLQERLRIDTYGVELVCEQGLDVLIHLIGTPTTDDLRVLEIIREECDRAEVQ